MKRHLIEYREKDFIKLQKRRDELWHQIRAVPKRKLKEPFQDGWTLYLVLSDEDMKRKDGEARSVAVNLVSDEYHTRNSKIISKMRKNLTMENARSLFTYRDFMGQLRYHGPNVKALKEKTWKELHPSIAKFFYRHERKYIIRWGSNEVTDVEYRLNLAESALKVRVKKRMVTEIKDIDPELQREYQWIEDQLADYYRHLPGHRNKYDPDKAPLERKHVKAAINKLIKGEIEEVTQYKKLAQLKREL